jgi:hypothetical protein
MILFIDSITDGSEHMQKAFVSLIHQDPIKLDLITCYLETVYCLTSQETNNNG